MELCGIRGLSLPTKIAAPVAKLARNEIELKIGPGPNIIVDLSRPPSSAHWTVPEIHKFEIRTSDQLLLGNIRERVTLAEIGNDQTAGSILQSTLNLGQAINQLRVIEQCQVLATASEAAKTQIIKSAKTA